MSYGLTATERIGSIPLEQKLGEGKHREVYRYGELVIKILKPYVRRNYGHFQVNVPSVFYNFYKAWTSDLNRYEYRNYQGIISQVPEELKDSFAKILDVVEHDGVSASISELVRRADGGIAQSLEENSRVENPKFWERFSRLERLFLKKDIPYFDVGARNILVKELENGDKIPVFSDYKVVGKRMYLFQLDLHTRAGRARKIKRAFSRIRERYQIKTLSET